MVERQLPKLNAVGSIPITRSMNKALCIKHSMIRKAYFYC